MVSTRPRPAPTRALIASRRPSRTAAVRTRASNRVSCMVCLRCRADHLPILSVAQAHAMWEITQFRERATARHLRDFAYAGRGEAVMKKDHPSGSAPGGALPLGYWGMVNPGGCPRVLPRV